MAFRAQLYSVLKPKLQQWHELSSTDNLDELCRLFSDFAKKPLSVKMLLTVLGLQCEMLDSAPRSDSHVISFEQLSKLFVTGVQPTDTHEFLQEVLDRHISALSQEKCTKENDPAGTEPELLPAPPLPFPPPAQPHEQIAQRSSSHDSPRDRRMSICGSVSTAHSEDRHTECKEEAAARRAAERQQEWCRYSLLLASVEDGPNIGNATIRAMCENLRHPSVVIKRRTLDELEQLVEPLKCQLPMKATM